MIPKYNLQYLDELNVAKKRVLEKQTQQLEVQKPEITDDMTIDTVLEDKKNRNKKSDNLLKEINNELENINIEFEVLLASILPKTGPGAPGTSAEKSLAIKYNKIQERMVKVVNDKADAVQVLKDNPLDNLEENEYNSIIEEYKKTGKTVTYNKIKYTKNIIDPYLKAQETIINSDVEIEKLKEEFEDVKYKISLLNKNIQAPELFAVKDVANSINDLLKKVLIKTTTMKNKVSKNISSSIFYDKYDIQKFNNLGSNFALLFKQFTDTFKAPTDYMYKYAVNKYNEIFDKIRNNIIEIKRYLVYGKENKQSTIQPPIMRGSGFTETPKRNYM